MCKDCPPFKNSDPNPKLLQEFLNTLEETLREGPPPGFEETEFSVENLIKTFQSIKATCNEAIEYLDSFSYSVPDKLDVAGRAFYRIAQCAEHNRESVAYQYKRLANKSKEN